MSDGCWSVYIILASDNSLYTGITTDIERRWYQHCRTARGARYFRGRKPQQLVYLEGDHDRPSASRREAAIKKLTRRQKLNLIASPGNCCGLWAGKLALPVNS
ncbi:GIY-YIG nuclease family protein [Endozoicomonas sp. SCSIO W0465]|nr:GIY-YIG nuclease family protein [Endozoicomonas sp. SCSIO W0465]USE39636.1 GIY-YIG nuclease family protein [Endozoicomonas sp. SCSIO W0465]